MELADLVVINTCSIRDRVEHKVLSMLGALRKLKEHNPDLVICVAGCVAQQVGRGLLARVPHLDLVIGPDQIAALPELVAAARDKQQRAAATEFVHRKDYAFPDVMAPEDGRVSSFVTVMKGCNKICSFCIVPFTRGREVSKPSQQVLDEIQLLVQHGVREVTLLGQNVNSYGKDRKDEVDFATLLRQVGDIDGLLRVRFTTSHPVDCTNALLEAFTQVPKLMPFFHLPVQSGSEAVLRAMRRAHGVDDYLQRIERLRAIAPHVALSTDIIVGFPGETDADFQLTLDLLEKVHFTSLYTFMYSARPGTTAAALPDDVPLSVKKARLAQVLAAQDRMSQAWLAGFRDREVEVLFEGLSRAAALGPNSLLGQLDGPPQVTGRTPQNVPVNVPAPDAQALAAWPGRLARVRVDRVHPHSLSGTLVGLHP